MTTFDDRTRANLDAALEEACRALPHGGDHTLRKRVAQQLLQCARRGNTTFTALAAVARTAVTEATRRRSGVG